MTEKYICNDCSKEVETTYTCGKCGDEICFDCAYSGTFTASGKTECPSCYMDITDQDERNKELLCLNQGVELWEGFTAISKETAIQKFRSDKEVFGLDYEGNESLIQEDSDFERFEMFVIEK